MKQLYFSILLLGVSFSNSAQTSGPINIIDNSTGSGGATNIHTADLDNDGRPEIIVSRGYNLDKIDLYWNNGSGSFSMTTLDQAMDPVFVNSGDFDGNGFQDIAIITESSGELSYYPNTNGAFGNAVLVDAESTFGKNIAPGDFDNDGDEDMVVIWQHSINFYRNDGNANFTKETILTTSTSPNLLECWDMASADMDNDGDLDVVTAETIGGVIYENDGNANFTPLTFTGSNNITMTRLTILDADNDNLPDVALFGQAGKMELYLNLSQLNFSYHSDLFTATQNSIKSIVSIDADLDGDVDIYTAFDGNPRMFFNDGNLGFAQELVLDPDPNIFVEEITPVNIVGNNHIEFIWGGAGNTLAYQQLENLAFREFKTGEITLFPNPVKGKLNIGIPAEQVAEISIFNMLGRELLTKQIGLPAVLNLSGLAEGMYFMEIRNQNFNQTESFIKR